MMIQHVNRLEEFFGHRAYKPSERKAIINIMSSFDESVVEKAVSSLIMNNNFLPYTTEVRNALRAANSSNDRYTGEDVTRCKDCYDIGLAFCDAEFEYILMRCWCEWGCFVSNEYESIPQLNSSSDPRIKPFPLELFNVEKIYSGKDMTYPEARMIVSGWWQDIKSISIEYWNDKI